MGKYLGAKLKKLRYFNLTFLSGFSSKLLKKEASLVKKKTKISLFLSKLLEKQKLKYNYGLKENQIKKYLQYIKLLKIFNLVQIIELRLDASLFRIGFSRSINQAKQFINHGHIFVNCKLVKKPNMIITEKDLIYINPQKKNIILIARINLFYRYYKKFKFAFCNINLCTEFLKFKLKKKACFKIYFFNLFKESYIKFFYKN